jgi:signal recognition particle subunit SRP72
LSKELPSLQDIVANSTIDIDTLDNQFSLLSSKYSKLKSSTAVGAKSPIAKESVDNKIKKKKNKKKKVILPKNYNPTIAPDPERWIPLRERSYYKGKRNKKRGQAIGKGTQGSVSSKEIPQSPIKSPENEKFKSKVAAMEKSSSGGGRNARKKKGGSKW